MFMIQERCQTLLLKISYELRDKLEKEWAGDYGSCMSYPFFQWVAWKYNAKLIRAIPDHPFAFEFKTEEDKNQFLEKWL